MKAKSQPFDLTYDGYFVAPAFALANSAVGNVGTLQALHKALNKRFDISPPEMRVSGGNSLSDVRVSLGLFRGNGLIEIDVEKVHIVLKSISGPDDIEIVKDCINLVQETLIATLDVEFRWANVTIASRMKADDSSIDVGTHFEELYTPTTIQSLNSKSADFKDRVGMVYECESSEKKWDCIFYATRNRDQFSEISVFTIFRFLDLNLFPSIADQADQIDAAFVSFLERADIDLSTNGEE